MSTATEYGTENNTRHWDNQEAVCIHAGTPGFCPAGTLAHESSLGDCCARCERDGYLEEASRLSRQVKTASYPQSDVLRGELMSTLNDWANWSQIAASERAANVNAPARYPFVRKVGAI